MPHYDFGPIVCFSSSGESIIHAVTYLALTKPRFAHIACPTW